MAKKSAKKKAKRIPGISGMLIKTYGLYWKRDDVFWGTQGAGKAGSLYGIHYGKKKSAPVDFREQTGLYVLYSDYRIIYIGQAGNGNAKLFNRLKAHLKDELAGRWDRFSWFGLQWVRKTDNQLVAPNETFHSSNNVILNHIEAVLIHSSEPPLNRQGGRWSKKVERYIQHRDQDTLGATENEMIKKLYDRTFEAAVDA